MSTAADELPPIGAPATRALAAEGITRLDQVRDWRAADLLALHGVGPRAIRILDAALAERGWSFASAGSGGALRPEVQRHIDALDERHRVLFDRLHAIVLAELPEADVVISYGIPIYRVSGGHVGLNTGLAAGVTLTATSPDHIAAFRERHPEMKTGKASIQFGFDDDLPEDDIREVIRRATAA